MKPGPSWLPLNRCETELVGRWVWRSGSDKGKRSDCAGSTSIWSKGRCGFGGSCNGRKAVAWSFEPKGRSHRVVPLPAQLVRSLRAHRKSQLAERLASGTSWSENDLVFCQPDGNPIDPRRDWAEWKALLAAAGVRDARVHDARHTAGTLLIEQGVHPRVVMEILGHSDLRLTQRYTHASSAMAADAAERMNRALWGIK
jgi:integrase